MSQPNTALAELSKVLGEDNAREVVRSFIAAFPSTLRDLASGDRVKQCRTAHSLKGTARQMGAIALSDQMAELEKRLAQPGERVTPADLADIAREFAAAASPLKAFAGV